MNPYYDLIPKSPSTGFRFDPNQGLIRNQQSPYGYQFNPETNTLQSIDKPVGKFGSNLQGGSTMAPATPDYLSAATGALQLGSNIYGIASRKFDIGNPAAPVYQEGMDPSYQSGEYFNKAYSLTPKGASAGDILSSTAQGAMTGAKAGGVPGAIIGGAVGLIGSIGGGEIARARQRRQKQKALKSATAQQQQFNTMQEQYDQSQAAREEYTRRADPYRRMMNLYSL